MSITVKYTKPPGPPPPIDEIQITCCVTPEDILNVTAIEDDAIYVITHRKAVRERTRCVGISRADWNKLVEVLRPWAEQKDE